MKKRRLFLLSLLSAFWSLPTLASTEQKSETYNVSFEMTTYRLEEMGLFDKETGLTNKMTFTSRPAELIFLDDSKLRFRFETPVVINMQSKENSESRLQRILPYFDVNLSERQAHNFAVMRKMDEIRAVMVNDIPEEPINFRDFLDRVDTLNPKDFGDGRIYRVPLLVKPINTLHLQNVALEQILEGKTPTVGISIETKIIQNINLTENKVSFLPEFHRVYLAESMEHVYIRDSRVANLASFREQARVMKEEGLRNFYANPRGFAQRSETRTTVSKAIPLESATILQLNTNTRLCRSFIGSKKSTGDVIQLSL